LRFVSTKTIVIDPSRPLYKWAKTFSRVQRNFFIEEVRLRREKQIEDFIVLNEFSNIKFVTDTDVFNTLNSAITKVNKLIDADLVVITDQKFSRYPCPVIIEKIEEYLDKCPNLYLCLNRHYINIDNSYHDTTLDDNFCLAITQWLKKNLSNCSIVDLSLNYIDYGQSFTWVIPDRQYFIKRIN
jgi:hypothetical protein